MSLVFLFYTHSDYSDIWTIVSDTSQIIPKNYKRLIAINSNSPTQPSGYDGIITYDDTLAYSDRVLSILNELDAEYVAFIHDNDLLMSFSDTIFIDLFSIVRNYKIDRCIFGIIGDNNGSIHHSQFSLVKSTNTQTPHFLIPYDVGPSIWKVQSFKDGLSLIPNTSYRDIESSAIQKYCGEQLNVYGFALNDPNRPYYVIGRPFTETFQFLHLFVRGKLYESYVYMDQEDNFKTLMSKYPALMNRSINDDSYSVYHYLCPRTM